MPTIQIDNEANALVLQHVTEEKQAATRKGEPTKHISKNKLVNDLIKRALNAPSTRSKPKREAQP